MRLRKSGKPTSPPAFPIRIRDGKKRSHRLHPQEGSGNGCAASPTELEAPRSSIGVVNHPRGHGERPGDAARDGGLYRARGGIERDGRERNDRTAEQLSNSTARRPATGKRRLTGCRMALAPAGRRGKGELWARRDGESRERRGQRATPALPFFGGGNEGTQGSRNACRVSNAPPGRRWPADRYRFSRDGMPECDIALCEPNCEMRCLFSSLPPTSAFFK